MLLEENLEFGFALQRREASHLKAPLADQLLAFKEFGKATQGPNRGDHLRRGAGGWCRLTSTSSGPSKQRAASSLHEVSYRACFKPQLPRFFIERLTEPGDVVYDPFMGRGTTVGRSRAAGARALWVRREPAERRADPAEAASARAWRRWYAAGGGGLLQCGELPEDLLVFLPPGDAAGDLRAEELPD